MEGEVGVAEGEVGVAEGEVGVAEGEVGVAEGEVGEVGVAEGEVGVAGAVRAAVRLLFRLGVAVAEVPLSCLELSSSESVGTGELRGEPDSTPGNGHTVSL